MIGHAKKHFQFNSWKSLNSVFIILQKNLLYVSFKSISISAVKMHIIPLIPFDKMHSKNNKISFEYLYLS